MKTFENVNKPLMWTTALLLTAMLAGCGGNDGAPGAPGEPGAPGTPGTPGTPAPGANPGAVNLGSAASYALTTSSGLTTTGVANFGGNVAMDAPTQTCMATPVASGVTATQDSCGMEAASGVPATTNIDVINPPITATPTGLTITGTTIRYDILNSAAFNATVRAVKDDVHAAYLDAARRVGGVALPGPYGSSYLDGITLSPGVYGNMGYYMYLDDGQTLTLDGGGNPNAVWIFQAFALSVSGSTVACTGGNTAPVVCTPTQVKLVNGALARNVFWEVGTPNVFGDGDGGVNFYAGAADAPAENDTIFKGTILAGSSVTFNGGSTAVEGRVLAGAELSGTPNVSGGAVTTTAGTGPVTVTLPK